MINLELLWKIKYNVPDVLSNDIDALVYRIDFIRKREPSSMYIPLDFNMLIWSMYCYVNLFHEINFINYNRNSTSIKHRASFVSLESSA